mgnify:CR=1 FL=1
MNIKKIVKNAITLLTSVEKMRQYFDYCRASLLHGKGRLSVPYGGKIETSSFTEHWSAYNLMPDATELNLMKKRATENSIVFDIGANVGVWTVLLSRTCPSAKIHSFEPAPDTYKLLERNVLINQCLNVVANNIAASDNDGVVAFEVPNGVSIYGRVRPEKQGQDDCGRFAHSDMYEVKCARLSDYCEKHDIEQIDFMKIDVEGFELQVLRGMEEFFMNKKVGAIYIETMKENHIRMASSYREFLDFFGKVGYKIYTLSEGGGAQNEVTPDQVTAHNHLCVPG